MSKTARKPLSKRIRFEVFKRDSFTCQYCGAKAPEAILHVDHIEPVSLGGDNDLLSLITSCSTCNSGKSNIPLGDGSAVQKQRAMIDELAQRREQIEMMLSWRDALKKIDEDLVQNAIDGWHQALPGWKVNESGIGQLRKLLRTYTIVEILDAMDVAVDNYVCTGEDGKFTEESVYEAWRKLPAIARAARMPKSERELLYIRGICRNRFNYCNDRLCLDLLKEAHGYGVDIETLTRISKRARNWTDWRSDMHSIIDEWSA